MTTKCPTCGTMLELLGSTTSGGIHRSILWCPNDGLVRVEYADRVENHVPLIAAQGNECQSFHRIEVRRAG